MALSRLLLITTCALLVLPNGSFAQFEPTTAKQDGIIILDALGRFFSAPLDDESVGAILFQELEDNNQSIGFPAPVIKDLETVANPDGSIKGAYAVDIFGGQFALTKAPDSPTAPDNPAIASPLELGQNNEQFSSPPFFGFDVVEDLEVAPDWRDVTHGYNGYFLLDADGVVHTLGETNLPKYAFFTDPNSTNVEDAEISSSAYPTTIDVSGSTIDGTGLLTGGPLNIPVNRPFTSNQLVESVTPIFTYFGFGADIARDLEISTEFASLTTPQRNSDGTADLGAAPQNRRIAMTNGYYILDGFGAVHSNRLPLDFDINNDGVVNSDDLFADPMNSDDINPEFGTPINNAPLSVPWLSDRENLPYFGSDVAVDIELTPSGRGFYLLDAFGGVFGIGDAIFNFPPEEVDGQLVATNSTTPYFGFPIARDLTVVPNNANPSIGLTDNSTTVGFLVIDGFGTVHTAGQAEDFNVSSEGDGGSSVTSFSDTFRAVEISPKAVPRAPAIRNFSVEGDLPVSVAPGFRNVTASFSTISSPQ